MSAAHLSAAAAGKHWEALEMRAAGHKTNVVVVVFFPTYTCVLGFHSNML